MQQPQIPLPPEAVFTPPFWVTMPPTAVVGIVLLVSVAATIILWPIVRAIARRLEGRTASHTDLGLREEVTQLHARLGEVEVIQARLAELEERVDFTERLLAQHRDPSRLGEREQR
ncbi:MAG: hypothetical protein ACREMO_06095 [Gemmatimonadales bacterium]